jgi:hypothetical protein
MPYIARDMVLMAAGAGRQFYFYRTEDATTVVDTTGYFNAAADMLNVGDLIYRLTVNASGVVQTAGFHVVLSNASGVVDTSDTLALTVTDTD